MPTEVYLKSAKKLKVPPPPKHTLSFSHVSRRQYMWFIADYGISDSAATEVLGLAFISLHSFHWLPLDPGGVSAGHKRRDGFVCI
jgi:hypothetical protein